MNWFKSLSINVKIMLIGAVGILGFIVYTGFGYLQASNNEKKLVNIREINYPVLERTDANVARMVRIKDLLGTAVYTEDEDMVNETTDQLAKQMQTAFEQISKIDPSRSKDVSALQEAFKNYYDIARSVTLGLINGEIPEEKRQEATLKMINAMNDFEKKMREYRKKEYNSFLSTVDGTISSFQKANITGLLIGILLTLILVAAVFTIGRMINRSISQVAGSLEEIATGEGDLTKRLSTPSKDVIGRLVLNFNTFMQKLHSIIQDITGSTDRLSSVANEISSLSKQSNESARLQHMKTEEVAVAIEGLVHSIDEVAKSAEAAAEAAQNARYEANSGSEVVGSTISAIQKVADEVQEASEVIQKLKNDTESIGRVLEVIRDISDQTNLLALNAAIEAARAGEHGRGFAVVADEVRMLAARTHDSIQEIRGVIELLQSGTGEAVNVMERGREQAVLSVERASKAGESLDTIIGTVTTISKMNRQISESAADQTNVVGEINQNIGDIRKIGEQTYEGAKKTAAAGETTAELTQNLKKLVGKFKV